MKELKANQPVQGQYPTCEICFKNIGRKAQTIAHRMKDGTLKGYVSCGACYTLWFRIQQMGRKDLLTWDESDRGPD